MRLLVRGALLSWVPYVETPSFVACLHRENGTPAEGKPAVETASKGASGEQFHQHALLSQALGLTAAEAPLCAGWRPSVGSHIWLANLQAGAKDHLLRPC
jgi:hypothetical protein